MGLEYSTSCLDWEDRILSGRSIIPPPLFPEVAADYLMTFKDIRLPDLLNQPKIGDISKEWIFDFANAVFGSLRPDGVRFINEFFLEIPKKNTKSTIAAAVMLTALIKNWRPYAEFFIIAPTLNVADNSFQPLCGMINADDELRRIINISVHTRTVTHRVTKAKLKVLAARDDNVSGLKGVGILFDELWLFGKRKGIHSMFREIKGGFVARPEAFAIYLTTQSDEAPSGIFYSLLNKARNVRDGKVKDNRFLPILYEFPRKMIYDGSCRNPENWGLVNPNLGASIDLERLKSDYITALEDGEQNVQDFLAKHLNVEIGLALRDNRWLGAARWEENERTFGLQYILDNSEVITIGIDGGGLDDFLGLGVIGRTADGLWLQWAKAWVSQDLLEHRKNIAEVVSDFNQSGELKLIENIGDDTAEMAQIVKQIYQSGLLSQIGIDPYGIGGVLDALAAVGIPESKIIGIRQGLALKNAIVTLERKLGENRVQVSNSALMRWCVSNAVVEMTATGFMIKKSASKAKIDPLVATFNAVELMSRNPAAKGNIDNYLGSMVIA